MPYCSNCAIINTDKMITFSMAESRWDWHAQPTRTGFCLFFICLSFLSLASYTLVYKYSGRLVPALLPVDKLFRCIQDSAHNTGKIPFLKAKICFIHCVPPPVRMSGVFYRQYLLSYQCCLMPFQNWLYYIFLHT